MTRKGNAEPVLARELILKAKELRWSEEELCKHLKVIHSTFSRWKNNKRPAPDPRLIENWPFFERSAQLLGIEVGQVIGQVCFGDTWYADSRVAPLKVNTQKLAPDLELPSLAPSTVVLLDQIFMNLPGRETYVPVLLESFRAYVEKCLRDVWREHRPPKAD